MSIHYTCSIHIHYILQYISYNTTYTPGSPSEWLIADLLDEGAVREPTLCAGAAGVIVRVAVILKRALFFSVAVAVRERDLTLQHSFFAFTSFFTKAENQCRSLRLPPAARENG
jgi:hypothetical protein